MTKFATILAEAVRASGLDTKRYAANWGVPRRTFGHWLAGTPPSSKYLSKIEERFPQADYQGLFDEDAPAGSPASGNGLWSPAQTKIMLARMNITNLMFIFEWLVYDVSAQERNQFRDTLGAEWENFMNLARALVNEKSREVGFTEKRLNNSRRCNT